MERNFVSPRFIATGKMSCLRFGEFWNSLGRAMESRGLNLVHVDEKYSTCMCLCGSYSPPGLSRVFHCSNPSCLFSDARDPKSSSFIFSLFFTLIENQVPYRVNPKKRQGNDTTQNGSRKKPKDLSSSSSSSSVAPAIKVSTKVNQAPSTLRHHVSEEASFLLR